jgi:hypothetical protein
MSLQSRCVVVDGQWSSAHANAKMLDAFTIKPENSKWICVSKSVANGWTASDPPPQCPRWISCASSLLGYHANARYGGVLLSRNPSVPRSGTLPYLVLRHRCRKTRSQPSNRLRIRHRSFKQRSRFPHSRRIRRLSQINLKIVPTPPHEGTIFNVLEAPILDAINKFSPRVVIEPGYNVDEVNIRYSGDSISTISVTTKKEATPSHGSLSYSAKEYRRTYQFVAQPKQ